LAVTFRQKKHPRRRQPLSRCLLLLSGLVLAATPRVREAAAQDPSRSYLSIRTAHFTVTFTRPLEALARRVAADAERAYEQLSREMHEPRGPIDILVSDDADYSNGSATTYPTNRIVVYATPPVNESGLRFTTDWAQLVVTHELAHIFHLDRSRGLWRLGQYVFGRSPFLFPNAYQPSWLIEGLAVYEESRLAGQGRIEAPEHSLIARAAALDHAFPTIGQASLALPSFPRGSSAYVYGSLFFDYLARTRGEGTVRRFVESSSAQLVPYLIDIPAKRAFGTTFNRAWAEWRASVEGSLPASANPPLPDWKELTSGSLALSYPRWLDDSTLTFAGGDGKESYGAYALTLGGRRDRLGRRNSPSPTSRLADGSLLFAQSDYTNPYVFRSDLYLQRGGDQRRLTLGQRLFEPDARADGSIVATQIVEGASRIVRVSSDGATLTPLTPASLDTLWNEPRWSHAGDAVVAVRWIRGGISQIVVIDTLGAIRRVVTSGRFLASSPAWIAGDQGVSYALGAGGGNDVYTTLFRSNASSAPGVTAFPAAGTFRLSQSPTGLFEPQFSPRQPATIAAVTLRGDGYRLGVGRCCSLDNMVETSLDSTPDPRLPALAVDSSPTESYSALRQLLPRYWVPLAEAGLSAGSYRVGGYTEAWDILRRHYLYGELRLASDNSGILAAGQYTYRGLGLPIVSLVASQDWSSFATVYSTDSPAVLLGTVRRRIRDGELLVTYSRPRARHSFSASVGAGMERRDYVSLPDSLLARIASSYPKGDFPRVTLSTSYANYQTPAFAISPEDGFTVAATARERLRSGFSARGGVSTSVVTALTAYKSLGLPGYAHHVLAVRGAAGWADTKTNGYFQVGGTSGGSYQVVPGYTVGEGRQTFPVRGFPPGVLRGIRAFSGSAEYRAPLSLTHRTLGTLPAFLQRSAVALFGDYGRAWCPGTVLDREICNDPDLEFRADVASVGAELSINAGVLSWDSPYRFRLGVAMPIQNGAALGARQFSVYFTSGISF
jgi:hypothetical protein